MRMPQVFGESGNSGNTTGPQVHFSAIKKWQYVDLEELLDLRQVQDREMFVKEALMSELSLSLCPICHAPNSLSRSQREVSGQAYVWYDCGECASALLWVGGDQWIYQKIGRPEKEHLLKQLLSLDELESMLPVAQDDWPAWLLRAEGEWADSQPQAGPEPDAPPVLDEWAELRPPAEFEGAESPPAPDEWQIPRQPEDEWAALRPQSEPEFEAQQPSLVQDEWQTLRPRAEAQWEAEPFPAGDVSETLPLPFDNEGLGGEATEEKRASFVPRVIRWLIVLSLIGLLGLVGIIVYQAMTGQFALF